MSCGTSHSQEAKFNENLSKKYQTPQVYLVDAITNTVWYQKHVLIPDSFNFILNKWKEFAVNSNFDTPILCSGEWCYVLGTNFHSRFQYMSGATVVVCLFYYRLSFKRNPLQALTTFLVSLCFFGCTSSKNNSIISIATFWRLFWKIKLQIKKIIIGKILTLV